MDKMIYHTGHFLRQVNFIPQVFDLGYLNKKTDAVVKTYYSCNFSFILKGDGWYNYKGQQIKVEAPAIILQWPGEPNNYGPDTRWEEFFLIYPKSTYSLLKKSGLFNIENPVIPLKSFQRTTSLIGEILQLVRSGMTVFPIDRLDLLCWNLINETPLYSVSTENLTNTEIKIKKVADRIKSSPLEFWDFTILAREQGMALPTFRRNWLQYMGVSPGRYIADLKLSIACRLLIKTDKPIYEIASDINVRDALYFSRFFKKKTGLSPREYRHNYQFRKDIKS